MQMLNKLDYIKNNFLSDKEMYVSYSSKIKTGFSVIDSNLSIRPGVYLLGGIPSVGKTTLAVQLSDEFAKQGNHVLFFSLEQSNYDLTNKSISRIQHIVGNKRNEALAIYRLQYAENITTVISHTSVSIEDIKRVVAQYINQFNIVPIVFVDYLQLIQTGFSPNKRDAVTYVSNQLVNISKEYNLTMFVLSSLNRTNYISPIDFESFKESGSLEYDADVVFGLQYQLMSNTNFLKCQSVDLKRVMFNNEKAADVRKVELVCLKNRFGTTAFTCPLEYYANHDLFAEQIENKKKVTNKSQYI